jgi:hypothetical protein
MMSSERNAEWFSKQRLRAGEPHADYWEASVGEFEAPYAFSGTLYRVVFELGEDQEVDPAGELRGALRRQ